MRKLTPAQEIFTEKPMDRMEMYDLLAAIYVKTCIHYEKVGLRPFIKKNGKPTIVGKYDLIYHVMVSSELLLTEGRTNGLRYKWNMKKYGPVSLIVTDMILDEVTKLKRARGNKYYRNRYAAGKHWNSPQRKRS